MNFKQQLTGPTIPVPSLGDAPQDETQWPQITPPKVQLPKLNYSVIGSAPDISVIQQPMGQQVAEPQRRMINLDE